MPLKKPIKDLKKAVLVPCYKRPEYTARCLEALFLAEGDRNIHYFLVDDGSNDGTASILQRYFAGNVDVLLNKDNKGLRQTIIDFFAIAGGDFDILAKIDNDCLVPKYWLSDIIHVFENSPADILSPNVNPSDAAHKYGQRDEVGYGYRPTKVIGGLWVMKSEMIDDIQFEVHEINGIKGAIPLLRQIITEKDPIMGWVPDVVVQDLGHWSGEHPENIKTKQHEEYYREIGRNIAWSAT